MASKGFLGRIAGGIGNLFRSKKPLPPKVSRPIQVHRGVAAIDRAARAQAAEAGQIAWTQDEIDKWETLPPAFAEQFLFGARTFYVNSSNVAYARYFVEASNMEVGFLNGGVYLYSNVSLEDATNFLQAFSKGGAVWDIFRVRGSRIAHQRPYVRIR